MAFYATDELANDERFKDGNVLVLGKGILGTTGSARMVFVTPVPAAAWLFGSALGILVWARRRRDVTK